MRYIGVTKQFELRKKQHIRALNGSYHHNAKLLQDFNENKLSLEFYILFETSDMDLAYEKEEYYVKKFNTKIEGYNLADGGKYNKAYKQSEYAKSVASKVHSKKVGELNSFYGKKHSEETKRKISDSKKGKKGTPLSVQQREILYANNPRRMEVSCYGVIYDSFTKASESLGVDRKKISKMAYDKNNKDIFLVK